MLHATKLLHPCSSSAPGASSNLCTAVNSAIEARFAIHNFMDQPVPDIKAVLHDPESGNRIRAIEGCEQSVAGRGRRFYYQLLDCFTLADSKRQITNA